MTACHASAPRDSYNDAEWHIWQEFAALRTYLVEDLCCNVPPFTVDDFRRGVDLQASHVLPRVSNLGIDLTSVTDAP